MSYSDNKISTTHNSQDDHIAGMGYSDANKVSAREKYPSCWDSNPGFYH